MLGSVAHAWIWSVPPPPTTRKSRLAIWPQTLRAPAGGEAGCVLRVFVGLGAPALVGVGAPPADEEEVTLGHLPTDVAGPRRCVGVVFELDLDLAAADRVGLLLPERARALLERAVR